MHDGSREVSLISCSCSMELNKILNMSNCSNFNCSKNNSFYKSTTLLYYSEEAIIFFHTLYMAILFIGIFGNVLTCTVILHRPSMRRSIHFYTFNLAVCDLLILLFYVPTQMVYLKDQLEWTMGIEMCKVAYVVLPVSLVSSVCTLLAITIDRARGLIQPFKWRSDSRRTAKITIPITWLASLLLNIPLLIYPRLDEYESIVICGEGWPDPNHGHWYWIAMFVLVFAIPLSVIIATHLAMVYVMIKDKSSIHQKRNKRMIRMVVALVIVFSICTGFQHVYFFVLLFGKIKLSKESDGLLFGASNLVLSVQAALNPIIYGTLRQDFNKAFKNILLKLMIKLKIYKRKARKAEFLRSRMISTYVSTSASMIKSSGHEQLSLRCPPNDRRIVNENLDSPCISPRESFFHGDEPCLLSVRTSIKSIDTPIKAILRRNVLAQYEKSMPISEENHYHHQLELPEQTESLLSPTHVTASKTLHIEWLNKRMSKLNEYLNDSKETII